MNPIEAAVLREMQEAVVVADPQGVIRLWNPAAEKLFGFPQQEALGAHLNLIIPERFRPAHDAGFANAIAAGRLLKTEGRVLTTRSNHKETGRKLYVDFSFGLIHDPAGQVTGIFAVGRDATERFLQAKQAG